MIPELGHFALILALAMALIQSTCPMVGALRKNFEWMALAKPTAFGQFIFLIIAYSALTYSFVTSDFSVVYVAENSSTQLPWWYQVAALWGAHEGSLLLWVTILSIWTVAVCIFSRSLPPTILSLVLSVLGMISVGFLLFLLLTSNPFLRFLPEFPLQGRDLNPLLQDPGMAIHPPMLYMGYVGFAVAFAFAIAALITGKLDTAWARWTRPWTLIAWVFLTLGIVLGSGWAYRVLGWGGWWFWDPVENASFLPWLTGTALIHSLIVVEKRGAFKSWAVLLAICAFSLSLMGTFLVRSGILTSVHAFANDPTRGVFMLQFLSVVIGGSLLLYAWRATSVRGIGGFQLLSRETMLLTNNVLFVVMMLTILLGTLYPLLLDALNLGKISVGAPYFNTVFIPFMVLLLFLMGIGPLCRWQYMPIAELIKRLRYTLLAAISLSFLLPLIFADKINANVVLGLALAFWVLIATLQDTWVRVRQRGELRLSYSQSGMLFAHLGLVVCVIGVTLTSNYHLERDVRMRVGETVQVGPYDFHFAKLIDNQGVNYTGLTALFLVSKQQKSVTQLSPEKRYYSVAKMPMTKAAIAAGVTHDLYVALGESVADDAWGVRIYYKPFVRWIWAGGILMMLGGLLAAFDKRYRLYSLVLDKK